MTFLASLIRTMTFKSSSQVAVKCLTYPLNELNTIRMAPSAVGVKKGPTVLVRSSHTNLKPHPAF